MYVGDLIELIREKTGNNGFTRDTTTGATTEGISDDIILTFINDALAFLQSRIISVYPGAFVVEDIQNTVSDQEEYEFDDNVFINNKFISVEFSRDGNSENYFPLPPASFVQRDTKRGEVYQYIRRNGKILLNRIPQNATGKLRTQYYRAIDKLNIRRGQITSKTSTSITLDSDDWLDNFAIDNAAYICIVDAQGIVQDYNVVVSSYNSSTRVITIPSQTLVGVAGNYIVTGRYQASHLSSEHPERMLDYCRVYAHARIYNTDSSVDEINEKVEVKDILLDIVDSFSELNEDVTDVPIVDNGLR